ncbi:MAG: M56 family metallopeptidase [Hungatella sp.]|nr:M56 family metallopeptidase [Hungatella sp.]
MFQNLLLTMSLSGSTIMILYLLSYPISKRFFPLAWRYQILKVAGIFYLIPFSECKYYVAGILKHLVPDLWKKIYSTPDFRAEYSIIVYGETLLFSSNVYKVISILIICGCIAIIIFSKSIIQNRREKDMYLTGSGKPINQDLEEIFSEIKRELNIKQHVRLICSEYCLSPMTCGILFPIVWFPIYKEDVDKASYQYMIRHELMHIKHHDILIKYLSLLVIALHWFNPLSFLLYYEISCIGEMCCDSNVLEGQAEDACKEYGELLLQIATRKTTSDRKSLFMNMASTKNSKIIQRRIREMTTKKRNKTILSIASTIVICMAGAITSFAYEAPKTLTVNSPNDFSLESKFGKQREFSDETLFDGYFIDSTGNISEIEEPNSTERVLCKHDYSIDGFYSTHAKNSSGGCTVKEYNATQCSICGSVKVGSLDAVITYTKCPH